MEDTKNKNLWIGLAVVLVLVAGFLFWSMKKAVAPAVTDSNPVVEPTEDVTPGSVNTGSPAASISYANALIKYKNARLQLDPTCQASPDKMTFKNGASLMVDNRSSAQRTVKVGSVFSIKAYGFKIIKLSSATLPATWYVDCGKSQNVSTILIQK
ncbi:MAG: hypothetical protein WC793_02415 [Candidatus Paceibacterota bacterium]|jgi:hypothetical protein